MFFLNKYTQNASEDMICKIIQKQRQDLIFYYGKQHTIIIFITMSHTDRQKSTKLIQHESHIAIFDLFTAVYLLEICQEI